MQVYEERIYRLKRMLVISKDTALRSYLNDFKNCLPYKGQELADAFPVLDGCVVGKVIPAHHPKSEVITPRSDGGLLSGAAAGKATLAVGVQTF